MRYWQFGLFDAQAADCDFDIWSGWRAILAQPYGTSAQESNPNQYNNDVAYFSWIAGSNPLAYATLVNIDLTQIKATLGQIPVLLNVDWSFVPSASNTNRTIWISRMLHGWDVGDSTSRYQDKSALTTWYEDAYAPFEGQDVEATPTHVSTVDFTNGVRSYHSITPILQRALRDNTDVRFIMWGTGSVSTNQAFHCKPVTTSLRPTLEFFYLYPIEFYESVGGDIDYSSTVQEAEDGHYYLGAVERGATGSAVQGWIRNYTDSVKQVELFDDHPEWITPVQRVGTGTGNLDYVTLDEPATSQLYTVVFYSTTQYEVKAEAYRDNAIGYHPQIDANGSWRSDVNSSWTSPSGGLNLTAAMWQKALINSGDEFEVAVRGNTTDTTWPADSNDQVEITKDNAGSADATAWRPVLGHRERTTAAVTTDATSKFFPLRHIDTTEWNVGEPCYVHDQTNINEGQLASVQVRALGADSFTGSGLDDLVAPTGNYNGPENRTYRVQIDANGTPDTFSWSRDGTTTWVATGVNVQGTSFELDAGVWIYWSATTGHTIGDYWTFDADTWGLTISGLTNNSDAYSVGAYVAQTLPVRDLAAAKWSTVNADSGASESPASRIYLADTSPFTQNDVIFVQQTATGGDYESATIAAGGVTSTYIDLTTSLLNDYTDGDFCTVKGSGEAAFWMRPVATTTTVEELKRLRFNARIL